MGAPGLTSSDRTQHVALGIDPHILEAAQVRRVTDAEARDLGLSGPPSRDCAGVAYPYLDPATGRPVTCRVRRDRPEMEDGRPTRKYLAPYGDRRHLYLSAITGTSVLADSAIPVVLLEAEKSALMLASVALRTGRPLVPVAMGGCWGWRGRIGRAETPDGDRVDETGPLPDLDRIAWTDRDVIVWLDADASQNPQVAAAERALLRELAGRGARVRVARPADACGTEGPDDYRARTDDAAVLSVLEAARPSGMPAPALAVLERADAIAPQPVSWVWPGRIARGKTTLVAGHPGTGKSQLTCALTAAVTTGGRWPDGTTAPRGSVVMLSAEDDAADTVVPRLLAAGADLSRVHILQAVRDVSEDGRAVERGVRLDRDVAVLGQTLAQLGDVVMVTIDPVTAYMGGTDTHRTSDVRAVLAPVEALAQREGVAVVAVSHLNKAGGAEALTRITGSLAFVAAARAAYLVVRDPEDETRRLLLAAKSNLAVEPPGLAYTVAGVAVTAGGYEIPTSRVEWCAGTVDMRADEVLAQVTADPEARSERDEAVEWLREALANGPQPRRELERQAKADGLHWRTVHRGAKVLSVTMSRSGFGAGSIWALPAPFVPPDPHSCQPPDVARMGSVGTNGGGEAAKSAPPPRKATGQHGGESPTDDEAEMEASDVVNF